MDKLKIRKLFHGSSTSKFETQKKRISSLTDLEKSYYLVYLYLNRNISIDMCSLLFDTTIDILLQFFSDLDILNKYGNLKLCSECFEIKTLNEEQFYLYKNSPDGYAAKCKECQTSYFDQNKDRMRKNRKIWGEINKDKIGDYNESYYNENKDYFRDYSKAYGETHKDEIKAQNKKYNELNKDSIKVQSKIYRKENIAKILSWNANRRALRIQATPSWVNIKDIEKIYVEAKKLERSDGVKRDVDHIIPLNHPLVCGLHVPWNLQILTSTENRVKGNSFEIIIS